MIFTEFFPHFARVGNSIGTPSTVAAATAQQARAAGSAPHGERTVSTIPFLRIQVRIREFIVRRDPNNHRPSAAVMAILVRVTSGRFPPGPSSPPPNSFRTRKYWREIFYVSISLGREILAGGGPFRSTGAVAALPAALTAPLPGDDDSVRTGRQFFLFLRQSDYHQ